jgi:phosphoglucomutase
MSDLRETLDSAINEGVLLRTSSANILQLVSRSNNAVYRAAIDELIELKAWTELNDRFFKTLAFGTGGLRGRTIGRIVTRAERGTSGESDPCPQYPCVGTNAMNFYSVSRATQGLVNYLKKHLHATLPGSRPSLAVAHDTRFFSRPFAELVARVATEKGCDVFLFEGPRSTPELSFAVRHNNAMAGIVITASHNPPHDNGYKVYFSDGAQVVEPHASGIIQEINSVESEVYQPVAEAERGKVVMLGEALDAIYKARLRTLVLEPEIVNRTELGIVFTPIHGTGATISVPLLQELGFHVLTVAEQMEPDGAFSTVKSPNPENAEALSLAIELARREGADLVVGTDPDCDRMGVAFRDAQGEIQLLTGNQIGSLLAYYRARTFKALGILTEENQSRGVIIKTLVTTDLQKAIAAREGLRCVETLTGFKYIGQKLGKYEAALPEKIRLQYRELNEEETRDARLQQSSFFVFGGEESYGYSGADFVRDKDGNAAAVMSAEVAAYAKSEGLCLDQLLDRIYVEYGYYLEKNGSLVFEGAEGADKIVKLAESYKTSPPTEIDGSPVEANRDFSQGGIKDVEGDTLPKEQMMMFELADGRRIAVRPSGTEPKIKFYMFGKRDQVTNATLPAVKKEIEEALERLWEWIQTDAKARVG